MPIKGTVILRVTVPFQYILALTIPAGITFWTHVARAAIFVHYRGFAVLTTLGAQVTNPHLLQVCFHFLFDLVTHCTAITGSAPAQNDPVLTFPARLSLAMITPLGEVFSPTSASMRQSVQRMAGHMI